MKIVIIGECDAELKARATAAMQSFLDEIIKLDTPEFRRKFLEGRMNQAGGFDWYMEPDYDRD